MVKNVHDEVFIRHLYNGLLNLNSLDSLSEISIFHHRRRDCSPREEEEQAYSEGLRIGSRDYSTIEEEEPTFH
jgi:hypothetical protein